MAILMICISRARVPATEHHCGVCGLYVCVILEGEMWSIGGVTHRNTAVKHTPNLHEFHSSILMMHIMCSAHLNSWFRSWY